MEVIRDRCPEHLVKGVRCTGGLRYAQRPGPRCLRLLPDTEWILINGRLVKSHQHSTGISS